MAKSEKLFEILRLIRECSDLTPKDLARLCDVSERAIYRYLNTLSEVGISIIFQDGGYKLQGDYSDIIGKTDPEGLAALRLLLLAGMRSYEDHRILKYGGEFLKLIEMKLSKREEQRTIEIEIVPEEIRAIHHGGEITIGHSSKPDIINPILTSETISVSLMNLLFSRLVRLDGTQQPIPDLAKYWEISKDGLVWTFFIREDVKFHDGHPLTAHDVEFTYKSIMDPKNKSPVAAWYNLVKEIETEGDYIFRITLKHPFAPFICRLFRAIAPQHLLENVDFYNTSFNRQPVGSGPFKLTDWTEDDTIVLSANGEYFRKDRPILDRLVFKSYPDRKSALQAITQDETDMVLNLAASDLLFMSNRGIFRIYPAPVPLYYAIVFDLKNPIFRDIRVRKALDCAIDKNLIIDNQLKGHGKICTGPFSVSSWAYNPDIEPTSYNVKRAKKLLEQAGWNDSDGNGVLDKDGKPFEILLTVPNISDTVERIAVSVKAQLMKIGIRVKLVRMSNDPKLWRTSFQAIVTTINSGLDPDHISRLWHSESRETNLASYENSFVDNLFELGRRTPDPKDRKAIYHKIHEMIHDDCPAIFLASAFEYIGSKYRFRNDRFSSILHFLMTMKDWQLIYKKEENSGHKYQEKVSALSKTSG